VTLGKLQGNPDDTALAEELSANVLTHEAAAPR
jgi:hypothetical protein